MRSWGQSGHGQPLGRISVASQECAKRPGAAFSAMRGAPPNQHTAPGQLPDLFKGTVAQSLKAVSRHTDVSTLVSACTQPHAYVKGSA